jgi:hypothetical protein
MEKSMPQKKRINKTTGFAIVPLEKTQKMSMRTNLIFCSVTNDGRADRACLLMVEGKCQPDG